MNNRITALYVATFENKVVAFGTNLSDFYRMIEKTITDHRNYQYYYRRFKSDDVFEIDGVRFEKLV